MWSDSLLVLERGHLLRLLIWGSASASIGILLLAWIAWRKPKVPLLQYFAIQTAAWGALVLIFATRGWQQLGLREFAGVTELVNLLWLNLGLFVGGVAVGVTLLLTGLRWGPHPKAVGTAVAVIVQALTLAVFELRFIDLIGPLR